MTTQVHLTSEMADLLYDTAQQMLMSGEKRMAVEAEDMIGFVTTDFKERALGAVGGTEFFAEVQTWLGDGKIKFLASPIDAEYRRSLQWSDHASPADLLRSMRVDRARYN